MATLRALTGDDEGGTMTGRELLGKLSVVIERDLHRVPADDPWRSTLERVLRANERLLGGTSPDRPAA